MPNSSYEDYYTSTVQHKDQFVLKQKKVESFRPLVQATQKNTERTIKEKPTLPKGKLKLFSVVLSLYTIMGLMLMLYILPFNRVNEVVVTGAEVSDVNNILAAANIQNWDKVKDVEASRQQIERAVIRDNPLVESVRLYRNHWTGLELHVNEHQVVGKTVIEHQVYPMLDSGDAITYAAFNKGWASLELDKLPLLIGFDKKDKRAEMGKVLKHMNYEMVAQMESIQLSKESSKPYTIEVTMKDGNTVRAVMGTFESKMKYYDKMVRELGDKKGIINLEVGAYFTPYGNGLNSVNLGNN